MSQTPRPQASLVALESAFGVLMGLPCGRVLHVNPAFCRLSGFAETHLRTHGCPWLRPALWASGTVTPREQLAKHGIELTSLMWPEPAGARLLLAHTPGAVVERAALKRLHAMLRGAMHELKTPVAGVLMGLECLGRQVACSPAAAQLMQEARRQLHWLNGTLDRLIHFAKAPELRPQQADLAALLAPLAQAADQPWGSIQWKAPSVPCTVWVDPEALQQLCKHLLDNAAEATGRAHSIDLAVTCSATLARLTVHDRGAGIEPAVAAQAFEPFFSTKHRHLGLGLSHAQRLARAHGGHVHLNSDVAGTVAEVVLPRQSVQPKGGGCE